MAIDKILSSIPSLHTILTIAISGIFGGVIALSTLFVLFPIDPSSPPSPPHDPRFAALGRLYHYQLGMAYATAWEDGATLLDSGKSLATALETVGKSWEENRRKLFDQIVTPAFSKLIPESTNDSDVSAQARAAMSAAWRGFASGLRR
jgi:hypothetical protein